MERTSYIISLLQQLGLRIHSKKSHLNPSQSIEYLGVVFRLDSLHLSLPDSKVEKILTLCQDTVLRSGRSRRQLESLVGLLSFAAYFVPLGRLRLRPVIS